MDMGYDCIAYLLVAVAFFFAGRHVYRLLRHPEKASPCDGCTSDCKLRGMKQAKRSGQTEKCAKKQENSHK